MITADTMHQLHPYPPFVPKDSKALILGSAPPCRFCHCAVCSPKAKDVDFYYGSSDNAFWDLLSEALQERRPHTLEDMKALLSTHNLAIADVLWEFERDNHSATDKMLKPISFNHQILTILKNLDTVFCTSMQVFMWLKADLRNLGFALTNFPEDSRKYSITGKLHDQCFAITCVILYSPSPRALIGITQNAVFKQRRRVNPDYPASMFRRDDYRRRFGS